MAIYAILHSAFHLFGTFPHITHDDNETIQKNKMLRKTFDHPPSYTELLFMSYPGITGLLLLIVTLVIATTSLR